MLIPSFEFAALPPRSAERLCLSGDFVNGLRRLRLRARRSLAR
jgi:hypothetical protein